MKRRIIRSTLSVIMAAVTVVTLFVPTFSTNAYAASKKSKAATSTIWIVGDSTVSSFTDAYYYPRYGWGTQIGNYLDGSFANSLYENYIKLAREVGCKVILVTPIVRRTTTGVWSNSNLHITATKGEFEGGDYPQAIRDLGKTLKIPVVDMTAQTKALYDKLGSDETLYLHAWTSSEPTSVDNTHTNIWGAKYNAYLITKTIKKLGISGLSKHVIKATSPTKLDTLIVNPNY